MENNHLGAERTCFHNWMNLQDQDLSELLQALNSPNPDNTHDDDRTAELTELVEKNIQHYNEYVTQRATLARNDVSSFFSPSWCSSFERSMLWAGGCRPSMYIRLVYTLCGHEIASNNFPDVHPTSTNISGLAWLTASQIRLINGLQQETIRQENNTTARLASLHEEIADRPIATIAKATVVPGEASREAEEALNALGLSMVNVLEEADNLRLNTLNQLMGILTPIEAVDFLASGKKLQLCLHAWGRMRDNEHGRH